MDGFQQMDQFGAPSGLGIEPKQCARPDQPIQGVEQFRRVDELDGKCLLRKLQEGGISGIVRGTHSADNNAIKITSFQTIGNIFQV